MRWLPLFALVAADIWSAVTAKPLLPTEDPWYDQPANIDTYAPGQTIRTRELSSQLSPFLPLPVDVKVESVHQYLFRTTDSLGNPIAAVNTLIKPRNADPSKLLAYALYYDSSNPACEPSYTLQPDSGSGLAGILSANNTLSTDTAFVSSNNPSVWPPPSASLTMFQSIVGRLSEPRMVGRDHRLRRSERPLFGRCDLRSSDFGRCSWSSN